MSAKDKATLEKRIDTAAQTLESKVAKWSDASFKRWIGSTEILLGFTNTYARWLITIASYAVLVGWGWYSFNFENSAPEYAIALLICLLLQAASVRFIFRWDELNDEYQSKRRDAAYRKAYRRIRQIIVVIALIWFFEIFVVGYISDHSGLVFQPPVQLDTYRIAVLTIFLVGLMSLQKYASYGMKGEPFVSVAEYRKQRQS
jgi:hypothetical protein